MCIVAVAWRSHPHYDLVVIANRDEYHERPAAALAAWEDAPHLIAGRDLLAGGMWLGIDTQGRCGIVTNFRDLERPRPQAPSRGALIPAFLSQRAAPHDFLMRQREFAHHYSGFNLLLADRDSLVYASNRSDSFSKPLQPGVYGLSNHLLDTPWPKLLQVREQLQQALQAQELTAATLLPILADSGPNNPGGIDLKEALLHPFVKHPTFGTRCSSVVLRSATETLIAEHRFDSQGRVSGKSQVVLKHVSNAVLVEKNDSVSWRK
jgi:uncharacterized protein with NRDE domain